MVKRYKLVRGPSVSGPAGTVYYDFRNMTTHKYFEDYATSLYSKNFFIKNMEAIALQMIKGKVENSKNKNKEKTWSVIFCDIDGLKLANDTLGHVEADIGIKNIATIIKQCIRTHREENDSIIYPEFEKGDNIPIRFGGDEFLLILPNCTKSKATIIRNRIKKEIEASQIVTRNMSLSMGIADTQEIPIPIIDDNDSVRGFVNDLITLAEKRMYLDKHKQVKTLSYEEQKDLVKKYLNRVSEQIGFDYQNPEELDTIINILHDIKADLIREQEKSNRSK